MPNVTQGNQGKSTTSIAYAKLVADLAGVTPQFIEWKEGTAGNQVLPVDLGKVENDLRPILLPGEESGAQANIGVFAVGKHYVIATVLRPTGAGAVLQVVDALGISPPRTISGLLQFAVGGHRFM